MRWIILPLKRCCVNTKRLADIFCSLTVENVTVNFNRPLANGQELIVHRLDKSKTPTFVRVLQI